MEGKITRSVFPLLVGKDPTSSSLKSIYPIYYLSLSDALNRQQLQNKYVRGYKLLQSHGWSVDDGIGKRGNGIKTPIEAIRVDGDLKTLVRDEGKHLCSILRELSDETEFDLTSKDKSVKFLPHVHIKTEIVDLLALIDTGCEISCINQSAYEQLKTRNQIPFLPI